MHGEPEMKEAKLLLYSKYSVLSKGKTCPKPNVPNPQHLLGTPWGGGLNPQNWPIDPSTSWRKGHEPPPHAALPVPVFELSHENGWPARVVHAPHAGEKSAQMSWAIPSPRLFRGSVVRTKAQVFAVAAVPADTQFPDVLIAVTGEGQPPGGAASSQFALVVTPVMWASAKAVMKCWAAAQKSGLTIGACQATAVVPVGVPVGQAALKLQL